MQVGGSIQNTGTDRVWLSRFMLVEPAQVTALAVHAGPTGGNAAEVRGVIYADASTTPTMLLGTTTPATVASASTRTWMRLAFSSPVALSPGSYWLGTHNASSLSFAYQSATGATRFANDVYADGADATYAGGATTYTMQMSIFAEYTR